MNYEAMKWLAPTLDYNFDFLILPPIRASPGNASGNFKRKDVVCHKSFIICSYKIHDRGEDFIVVMELLLSMRFLPFPKI